jgi:putative DNA primase/helicase
MAGDRVIQIDNVEQMLRSATLNSMLTLDSSAPIQVRPLGETDTIPVENHSVVMANGNNLAIFGEMERRWLQVDLEPNCDAPEDRKFDFDPVERAREMFPKLAVAGLTALRYWLQTGRPEQDYGKAAPEAGSYRVWNRTVRGLMVHLGFGDPMLTRSRVKENNPQRHDESALMEAFYRISPRGEPFTLHDIPDMAKTPESVARLAFTLLSDKGVWSANGAQWKVRRILGQAIDGKRLVSATGAQNKTQYRVEVVTEGKG